MIEKYLDMEAYGCNQILKQYSHFPKYLPLPSHLEHGWTPLPDALVTDLEIAEEKRQMLVYSKRREIAWEKATKIPVAIMGSPFVLYRQMHKIKKKKNASGTIVFPSHSTIFLESQFDMDEYCNKLKSLPAEFQPITICLLYPDIERSRDKFYIKNGFKVVSAGPKLRGSLEFVRNYYDILSSHKYATSNEVGTYAFYAVELGLPFFLYGEEPTVVNIGNRDKNIKSSVKTSDFQYGQEAIKYFNTKPSMKISEEQSKYVACEFGLNDCLKPLEMNEVLWENTKSVRYWLISLPMYWLMTLVKIITPRGLVYWFLKRFSK